MYFLISILLGVVPEAVFLALLFCHARRLETRRFMLCLGFVTVDVVLSCLFTFSVWLHASLIAAMYVVAAGLHKSELIDTFVIVCGILIIAITGVACFFLIPNYWAAFAANRVLLFGVLWLGRKHWHPWYLKYRYLWNRRDDGRIKAITLRNISLIALNLMLYAAAVSITYWGQICAWR